MLDQVSLPEACGFLSDENLHIEFTRDVFQEQRTQLKGLLKAAFLKQHADVVIDDLLDMRIVQWAGALIWERIKTYRPDVLVGVSLRGMPLLHMVALAANADGHAVQVLMVREQRKSHNLKKWVEGAIPPQNSRAVIISNYFADAETLSFIRAALYADDCIIDILAVSTMIDLTAYTGLAYADCDAKDINSIFSANDFFEELRARPNAASTLWHVYRMSLPRRDAVLMGRLRKNVEEYYRDFGQISNIEEVGELNLQQFLERASNGLPFIVRGAVSCWPLAKMTAADLSERYGDLHVSARMNDYIEKPFSPTRTHVDMSLRSYLETISDLSEGVPPYLGNQKLPELNALCNWPDYFQEDRGARIWLGPAGTVTPLHRDFDDNLFAQVWGRKQFILFPPNDAEFLSTWKVNLALDGSRFNPEDPDYRKYPLAKRASSTNCVLQPGDLLYLPAGWFHHVRSLDLSLSANAWSNLQPFVLQGKE